MGRITDKDIAMYQVINARYDTEEEIKQEVETWDINIPFKVIQDGMYMSYKGIILDVPFKMLMYRMTNKEDNSEVLIDSAMWEVPSKEEGKYYSGVFKQSTESLIKIGDIKIEDVIDFLSYYLYDATKYEINIKDIDEHAYRMGGRYFRVKLLLDRASNTDYYYVNKITRIGVEKRIVKGYKGLMEYHYGEEEVTRGLEKVKKFINKSGRGI